MRDSKTSYTDELPDGFQEIANILARGYLRLREKQAAVNHPVENFGLEVPANPSLHVTVVNGLKAANPNPKGGPK